MSEKELPDIAVLRSQIDQVQAMLRDLAPAVAEFWKCLVGEGVTPMAAAHITAEWLNALLKGNK